MTNEQIIDYVNECYDKDAPEVVAISLISRNDDLRDAARYVCSSVTADTPAQNLAPIIVKTVSAARADRDMRDSIHELARRINYDLRRAA
jgi:hypothetical protein